MSLIQCGSLGCIYTEAIHASGALSFNVEIQSEVLLCDLGASTNLGLSFGHLTFSVTPSAGRKKNPIGQWTEQRASMLFIMWQQMKSRKTLAVAPPTRGRGIDDILGQASNSNLTCVKSEAADKNMTGESRPVRMPLQAMSFVLLLTYVGTKRPKSSSPCVSCGRKGIRREKRCTYEVHQVCILQKLIRSVNVIWYSQTHIHHFYTLCDVVLKPLQLQTIIIFHPQSVNYIQLLCLVAFD